MTDSLDSEEAPPTMPGPLNSPQGVDAILAEWPPKMQHSIRQLALYDNMRDRLESGTVAWDDLDPVSRDAYLKEAYGRVMALIVLGWTPPEEEPS